MISLHGRPTPPGARSACTTYSVYSDRNENKTFEFCRCARVARPLDGSGRDYRCCMKCVNGSLVGKKPCGSAALAGRRGGWEKCEIQMSKAMWNDENPKGAGSLGNQQINWSNGGEAELKGFCIMRRTP